MKRFFALLLVTVLAGFGFSPSLCAAESSSPYDTTIDISKTTTSTVDATLDTVKNVDGHTAGKLAEFLKNSSLWKKLSENSQSWIANNIGKLGPWVKKLGWVVNAIDLAPSIYNTIASFQARDKESFKKHFRDTTLKTVSVLTGLAIGAAVTAALPAVVAATAATGGAALLVAAGGVVVTVGGGMLVDHIVKKVFSKGIEDFAGNLYDRMIGENVLDNVLTTGGGGGSGGKSGGKSGGSRSRSGGGSTTLDALQW